MKYAILSYVFMGIFTRSVSKLLDNERLRLEDLIFHEKRVKFRTLHVMFKKIELTND